MAKHGAITKRAVDQLQPKDDGKDVFLWDENLSGFGVRCRASGAKYYFLKIRVGRRGRWLTIGKHGSPWTPDSARSEALRLLGEREGGIDPAAERDSIKKNPTIAEVTEMFLEQHADAKRKTSTAKEYRRQFEVIIKPKLGLMQCCDVTRADIARLHHELRTTPYQANRTVALLSKIFTWADKRGVRLKDGGNPARGVERFKEEKRKLFLGADQLTKVGIAMRNLQQEGQLEPQEAAAIRLLLFTGCRISEILTLRWEYVDKGNGVLNLPDSKTGSRPIHLGAPALAVLNELPRIQGNPFVIPSPLGGQFKDRHLINLQDPWETIRKRAELPKTRLHDLRHAFGSMGAGIGLGLPVIGALLGHTQASTTLRYAHVASDPLKQAADIISGRLIEALDRGDSETTPADIVKIRR